MILAGIAPTTERSHCVYILFVLYYSYLAIFLLLRTGTRVLMEESTEPAKDHSCTIISFVLSLKNFIFHHV